MLLRCFIILFESSGGEFEERRRDADRMEGQYLFKQRETDMGSDVVMEATVFFGQKLDLRGRSKAHSGDCMATHAGTMHATAH